ncbi:MAG: transposase [Methanosarcinales archaeon]|uniref:Transposase n=1 Tax=Candidatus Ethanoperedens thermophilum TaxID=2766897 RepID=A0A848DB13_9EURY|nr:transposase [Candidatus Ethanoperedens thermophilum]
MKKKYKRTRSGWMRRTSRIYIRGANKSKIEELIKFLNLYQNIINYLLVRFWSSHDRDENFPTNGLIKSIQQRFGITARLAQCAAKQAKEIVRSQNEKNERTMPRFVSHIANLDSRFVTIEVFIGHFEMCLKFASGVPKIVIPFNWTKHTNKFRDDGWELAKSIRLGYNKKGLFIDLIFEKESPAMREEGETIGIDSGFNTMLVTSDEQFIGDGLKETIKRGGKRRKTWHHFVKTEVNRHLKDLNLDNIKLISLENLKNVKKGKRGKFSRNTNRLLSFWLYARVNERLTQLCEEQGIRIDRKNPWKTSQRCSVCGNIDRRNRKGEKFLCLECGHATNADYNASKNLKALGLAGVYSLRSLPTINVENGEFSI